MPKTTDHEKRKEQIANATLVTISEVGIENTTIRKISQKTNLSLGTVQYYFSTQNELYIYSMKLINKKMETRINSKIDSGMSMKEIAVTVLKNLIPHNHKYQFIEGEAWLSFSLMALKNNSLKELSNEMYTILNDVLINILSMLEKEGLLDGNFDLRQEATKLHAFIDGMIIETLIYPNLLKENDIELMIRDYLNMIIKFNYKIEK
ncbi:MULTISPECIES: TetR/AcrR family transcriptional regulator [Staphylococcus]|uniref:TetR/AcrR family transcriptional regulator n=1 Tax=Staphylococcaceae TaxID=90964 RepID=UPI000711200A|nr:MULTISPECIES: TetR/AcrR family transcriptional regulator [Staphylococcus]KRG11339.1 hypothetical protein ACA31_00230 [Staphylococcus sp. NAM3COL9]RIN26898.1 TetR family transcriptional regulator [Staphylococcus succinus]